MSNEAGSGATGGEASPETVGVSPAEGATLPPRTTAAAPPTVTLGPTG